ncbi:MAG: GNAT family N-acetyltransferase [Microbacterium sp.]
MTDTSAAGASRIRPYRPSDREAMYEVCVKTADAGADATGLFDDDRLWGDIFAVPYVERHPDLAWVVESPDGRTIGYIVSTDDTEAFEAWFRDEWWPGVAGRYPLSGEAEPSRQDGMIDYASRRGPGREQHVAAYPAHLHIDLLPETQGQGLGRRLIETLFAELRRRGVPGLHLGMNPGNAGAGAFYERIGMHRLESGPETTMYGVRFD